MAPDSSLGRDAGSGPAESKPWLAHYPKGIPAQIDLGEYASLKDLLTTTCGRFGDLPAFESMGQVMTYRQLELASRSFAAWLQKVARLQRGDRVALAMPNLLQYPVALFGVLRAGMVVVNTNPQYTPREFEHQLNDSGAKAIVVLENFAGTLAKVIGSTSVRTVITTEVGDLLPPLQRWLTNAVVKHIKRLVPPWEMADSVAFNRVLAIGSRNELDDVALGHGDLAFLQYTGGTTGAPKAAMLSHGNMVANVLQVAAWVGRDLHDGVETLAIPLPLYHVFALTGVLAFLSKGTRAVLITDPRDMPALLKTLEQTQPTAIIGVNTLFRAMLDAPGFAALDWRRLKLAVAGGMAVQQVVAQRWRDATGIPLVEGYGMTESAPVAIANPIDIVQWSGQIGLPLPSTEAAILGDDDRPLDLGEVGEIAVRGPQVMQGYWQRPEETAAAFTADGWLRTGDMGVMDEQGRFRITDRKKDMIVVSGFKVFPNEIEDVLALHPGVLESAAIGVADERTGEAVKVLVVRRDAGLGEAELLAHCRQHLTGYKVPRFIEFRTQALPKTAIGKVLRRSLRDEDRAAQAQAQAASGPLARSTSVK
ncbi:long-chain-fatty-acid--CoA ligase FadD [soil metagenome]